MLWLSLSVIWEGGREGGREGQGPDILIAIMYTSVTCLLHLHVTVYVTVRTVRVYSRGGGGNLPPLDCCLPPLQIGSNKSILFFQMIITNMSHNKSIFPTFPNIPRKYPDCAATLHFYMYTDCNRSLQF